MAAGFPFVSVLAATGASADIPAVTLTGGQTVLEKAAVKELAGALKGDLLAKGDPGYDESRIIWNGMHDRYPARSRTPALPA